MITVNLDIKRNCFLASFSNLGLTNVPIKDEYPEKYDFSGYSSSMGTLVSPKFEKEAKKQFLFISKWTVIISMTV